jgi:hypothetical protein
VKSVCSRRFGWRGPIEVKVQEAAQSLSGTKCSEFWTRMAMAFVPYNVPHTWLREDLERML